MCPVSSEACDSALRPCFVGSWGPGLVGYPRGCQACVAEKAALLVCSLDITESHWSLLGPSGLGRKHHLSFQLFLYLWSLGMYLVTAAAGQWWASSQVHRGFQASWSWGSGASPCSLRQKSPQPPPPATTVCAPTHLWFSALRGRLVTSGGRATLGSPSSFKEKRERLDGRGKNMDLLGLNYCMSHLGRYCHPHYTKETDFGR